MTYTETGPPHRKRPVNRVLVLGGARGLLRLVASPSTSVLVYLLEHMNERNRLCVTTDDVIDAETLSSQEVVAALSILGETGLLIAAARDPLPGWRVFVNPDFALSPMALDRTAADALFAEWDSARGVTSRRDQDGLKLRQIVAGAPHCDSDDELTRLDRATAELQALSRMDLLVALDVLRKAASAGS